ncbi:Acyl-coenzyme A oxidase 2 [Psilocybe cubensis]|nr:Acyl-coenzyme A oxidase 2 [Psilocybe cubensis]KAH9479295.1 Acyl-coenzyme A oxidase 2 [Psilocybe cubensis]
MATLINGKGRYAGGPNSPLAVINVVPALRYRFRLVSISCDPDFTFSIDGHSLTIIEVDSVNVAPLVVDEINILAGQRYSFVLNANQPIGSYWIRANPNSGTKGFDNGINSGILRYLGARKEDPKTNSTVNNPLLETNLHPLVNPAAPGLPFPGGADVKIHLDIQFDFSAFKYTVNNVSYSPPAIPVLLQILSGKSRAQDLLNPGSMYGLPPNKVIEISMNSGSLASPHPMHLHGHKFSVIESADGTGFNFINPVRRDVVSIGSDPNRNVTIRFKTDNPGPWIFHCHVDWHLEAGLSVVFAEDIPTIAKSKHPMAWDKLCPAFDALPPQTFP